jgi:hypothetical protein
VSHIKRSLTKRVTPPNRAARYLDLRKNEQSVFDSTVPFVQSPLRTPGDIEQCDTEVGRCSVR